MKHFIQFQNPDPLQHHQAEEFLIHEYIQGSVKRKILSKLCTKGNEDIFIRHFVNPIYTGGLKVPYGFLIAPRC